MNDKRKSRKKMSNGNPKTLKSQFVARLAECKDTDSLLRNILLGTVKTLRECEEPFSEVPCLYTVESGGEMHYWDLRGLELDFQYLQVAAACNHVNAWLAVYMVPGTTLEIEVPLGSAEDHHLAEVPNPLTCIFLYGATKTQRLTMVLPYIGGDPWTPLDHIEREPAVRRSYGFDESGPKILPNPWFAGVRWSSPSFCETKAQEPGDFDS